MLIYLDSCCINRPFDDQTQVRIYLEAVAVSTILRRVQDGKWSWLGSTALDLEIERTSDRERRLHLRTLLESVTRRAIIEEETNGRAWQLRKLGFGDFDALHLALAEANGAEIFLTTDDKLRRRAQRLKKEVKIRVENPLVWLQEVEGNEQADVNA